MMLIKNLSRNLIYVLITMLFLQLNFSCSRNDKQIIITKEGGSFINNTTAKRLIDGFQKKYRSTRYPLVSTLDLNNIKQLLQTKGISNIRIYYGEDPTKTINLVVVAANDEGVDIVGRTCLLITKAGAKLIPTVTAASYTHQFQQDYRDSTDFPYAEKFNIKYITALLRRTGFNQLSVSLGNDVENIMDKKSKKIKMVIFALDANGAIIRINTLTGKTRSANPTYQLANYTLQDEEDGLENGQQCLSMCNINSSSLYRD